MSDEQSTFKVTDRRLFNADGTPRDLASDEMPEPNSGSVTAEATAVKAKAPAQTEGPAAARPAQRESSSETEAAALDESQIAQDDPASFVNFIMSIASNAASALGMMEHPVTHKREVDLEFAKHWIDILGMLQQKTRGNLALEEQKILEGLLGEIRMQYVSMAGAEPPKSSRVFSGRDIIGGK